MCRRFTTRHWLNTRQERVQGEIVQADATLQQRRAEAENARGQVDFDVRTAFLNFNAAAKRSITSRFDYVGLTLLTLGIGALQIVLDKGQEDDWFGSHFITSLCVIAVVSLSSLIVWESFQKAPLIDVRLFKNFNFAASCLMFFSLGFVLYATSVVMPQMLQTQMLQTLMGYAAETAGFVLSGGSVLLLLTLPVVGKLSGKVPARYLIAFGWLTLSIGLFMSMRQTDLLMSFGAASLVRVYLSIPVAFLFVPITLVAYIGLPQEKSNAAAGLVNFHEEYRGKRRNFNRCDDACPQVAVSSVDPRGAYPFASI